MEDRGVAEKEKEDEKKEGEEAPKKKGGRSSGSSSRPSWSLFWAGAGHSPT